MAWLVFSTSWRCVMTIRAVWLTSLFTFCTFAFVVASATVRADSDNSGALWSSAGQNPNNTRFHSNEHTISVDNVSRLAVKWMFTTHGDVSATPSVDGAHVYFPDKGGYLYALDRNTGAVVWQTKIELATAVGGDY